MLFQSKWDNATYTMIPATQRVLADGRTVPGQAAVRANFAGPQRIFDSVAQQQAQGWDDETRLALERHLLTHKDFGRPGVAAEGGLWLAPGQTIPPEHSEAMPAETVLAAAEVMEAPAEQFRCAYVWPEDGGIVQCSRMAVSGSDYCAICGDLVAKAQEEAAGAPQEPATLPEPGEKPVAEVNA